MNKVERLPNDFNAIEKTLAIRRLRLKVDELVDATNALISKYNEPEQGLTDSDFKEASKPKKDVKCIVLFEEQIIDPKKDLVWSNFKGIDYHDVINAEVIIYMDRNTQKNTFLKNRWN